MSAAVVPPSPQPGDPRDAAARVRLESLTYGGAPLGDPRDAAWVRERVDQVLADPLYWFPVPQVDLDFIASRV